MTERIRQIIYVFIVTVPIGGVSWKIHFENGMKYYNALNSPYNYGIFYSVLHLFT